MGSTADPRLPGDVLHGYLTDPASSPDDVPDAIVVRSATPPRELRRFRLGPVTACLFAGGRVAVTPHHTARGDGLVVGYVDDGRVTVSQAGRRATVGAGQIVLYNAATPYSVQAGGPHRYLVVRVPAQRLRVHQLDHETAFAADLSAYPSARVLAVLLATVASQETPAAPAAQHLGDAVADCVHAVLAEHHRTATVTASALLFARLRDWLDEHLAEPDLGAGTLAASQYLSARYIRRIFAEHGTTVSDYIRRRRLEAIRDDLLDPRHETVKVSVIAARWGLRDPSVFSRLFSREFGESPQRFRRRNALEPS